MIGLQNLNPVLDRELRQRSRSRRSMIVLTLFLLLLTGILYLVYKGQETSQQFQFDPLSALTVRVGRTMFEWVLAAELLILLFIVPGVSAGAVSGERERQTLMPLQVTLMRPTGIFIGKVLASSGFVLLLVTATLPIMAVPYLVGGISLGNVVRSLVTLLVIGFLLAVIGVACSAIFRRTQGATLAAYGVVIALTVGTAVLLAVLAVIDASRGTDAADPPLAVLYPNPFVAVADAAGELGVPSDGPFSPIKEEFIRDQAGGAVFFDGNIAIDERTGRPVELDGAGRIPIWVRSLGSLSVVAGIMALVAVRRLRAPHPVME